MGDWAGRRSAGEGIREPCGPGAPSIQWGTLAKRANVRRLFPLLNSQNVISSSFLLARCAGSHSAICIYPRISAVLGAPLAQTDGLVSSALWQASCTRAVTSMGMVHAGIVA